MHTEKHGMVTFTMYLLLLPLCLAGCGHVGTCRTTTEHYNTLELKRIADDDLRSNLPSYAGYTKYEIAVWDLGPIWQVTYLLPEYTLGTGPFLQIDKKTMKVINRFVVPE